MSQPLRDRESVLSQTGGCRHVHHRDIVFTSEFLHPATDRPSSKSPRALSCEQFFLQNRQTARRASLRSLTPPTKQTDATISRHPHQTYPQHSPSVQSSQYSHSSSTIMPSFPTPFKFPSTRLWPRFGVGESSCPSNVPPSKSTGLFCFGFGLEIPCAPWGVSGSLRMGPLNSRLQPETGEYRCRTGCLRRSSLLRWTCPLSARAYSHPRFPS